MILLLSGPAAVGKSSICNELQSSHHFRAIKSSLYLREVAGEQNLDVSRSVLQKIGDDLDVTTSYTWLVDKVAAPQMASEPTIVNWFVDSVRKPEQIECFHRFYPSQVFHCHVTASEDVIRKRFEQRIASDPTGEYEIGYSDHLLHPNEISSRGLVTSADFVLENDGIELHEAAKKIIENTQK